MEIKNIGSKKKNPFSYPTMKKLICPNCGLSYCKCKKRDEENIDSNDESTGEVISGA